jgi:lysophospholipase L1-like esterase
MFSLVSKEVGVPIINKGVPGNNTFDGLERLDRDVLSQDPKIVFVLLGGNDYLQKIPKETTFQNLSTIIEKIQDRGAAVILLGVRGGIVDRFGEDYKALSEKYQTGYIPDVLEGLFIHREYMFDTIHPNDKGYRIISLRIIPVLKNLLEEN